MEENQSVLSYDNRHQGEDANNPVRPSATMVGGASARQPGNIFPSLNTFVSFEEIVLGLVPRSKIFAAKKSLDRSTTAHLNPCNQKRMFTIHCNFVITLLIM